MAEGEDVGGLILGYRSRLSEMQCQVSGGEEARDGGEVERFTLTHSSGFVTNLLERDWTHFHSGVALLRGACLLHL